MKHIRLSRILAVVSLSITACLALSGTALAARTSDFGPGVQGSSVPAPVGPGVSMSGGSADSAASAAAAAAAAAGQGTSSRSPMSGWETFADGTVHYKMNGSYVINHWEMIDGKWYFFNTEGVMLTGWQNISEEWFYLTEVANAAHPRGSAYILERTPDGQAVDDRGVLVTTLMRPDLYGSTFVEVNITTQTVNVFVNNTLMLTTPCVTGKNSTPTSLGTFRIYSKEKNRYLQGLNANGTKYKSWVNFWMPFNGGQGLHDATWRGAFGGTIYASGGSHGCVNLPYDAAAQIYSLSYVGMPVFVHK